MENHREAIRRIMIAVNMIDGSYESIAKHMKVKYNMLVLLYALDDGKTHTQKEICEQWLIPRTTINTIVKECIQEGYILLDSSQCQKEKRICITERGKAYTKVVLKQVYIMEQIAMEKTITQYSQEFIEALETFTNHFKAEIDGYIRKE